MDRLNRNTLAVLLLLVPILVWYPRLLSGYTISPTDVIYTWYPWAAYPPQGYTGPSNFVINDFTKLFLPWAQFAAASVRQGSFPLWNPLTGTGAPLVGNPQSTVFYPLTFLYYVLDPSLATTFQTILRLLLPGLFMYVWMRERKVDVSAALVAGLAFMMSGVVFMWAMLITPYIWIPLGFLATDRIIQRPSVKWTCTLATVTCLELLSGQPEFSIVTGFAQLSYLAYMVVIRSPVELQRFPDLKRVLMATAAAYGLGFAAASAQLLPSFEYLFASETWSIRTIVSPTSVQNLFPSSPVFVIFPGLLVRGVLVGPLVLLIALYSLFASKRRIRYFFTGLGVFAGIFAYAQGFSRFVPFLNLIRPNYMAALIPLSLCVLAGFGAEPIFDRFADSRGSLKWVLVLSSVLVIPILLLELLFLKTGVPVLWRWKEPSVPRNRRNSRSYLCLCRNYSSRQNGQVE